MDSKPAGSAMPENVAQRRKVVNNIRPYDLYVIPTCLRKVKSVFEVGRAGGVLRRRREKMRSAFLGLAMMLVFIWAIAFLAFHVAGFLIHLFLVLAAIFFFLHFATSPRTS